jgi:hypothetical protein
MADEWFGGHAPQAHSRYTVEAMTIDERLERLTERHEALTQSMELFQHDMAEMRAAAAERDAKYNERFSRILDVVETLAATARSHEQRIERLEG